jgi:acetaldehyde dehydrogenase (acetylating)
LRGTAKIVLNPSRNPIMTLDTHFFDDRAETV